MFEWMAPILVGVVIGYFLGWLFDRIQRAHQMRKAIKHAESLVNAKGLVLKPGWAHNPALKYPQNYPCFCGSGAKFKRCCFQKLPRYVKESQIPNIEKELKNCIQFVEAHMGKLKGET